MHPVLKRILWHGALAAGALAVVGVVFARLANQWLAGNAPATDDTANATFRVPLTMAMWGFGIVVMGELILWRVRGTQPTRPTAPPDDAEKLLNELLAQAETKMALEAETAKAEKKQETGEKQPEAGTEKPSEPRT